MSEPLRRSDHDDYAEAELKRWPGVTWERHHRSKHMALEIVKGQGQTKRRPRKVASDEPIKLDPREKTRLDQNPFDALAGFQSIEPVAPAEPPPQTPPPSLWRRILKAVLGGKA